MQPGIAVAPLRTFRILAGALMGAPVMIAIALAFVVGGDRTDRGGHRVHTHAPALWVYLVIVGLGVVAAILDQTLGYRVRPVKPGADPAEARTAALAAYQQTMMLRVAFSEAVAIVAIALLFTVQSDTILPYVVAAVIAEMLMAYHVWPGQRLVDRVQQRLDRDGGRSALSEALHGTA